MDFNDNFNDVSNFNQFNNNLFRTDDRLTRFNDPFNRAFQSRQDIDRDYGLMAIAPKMPMPM